MTILLCPGQGAQYAGMGREIAERWPAARSIFDRADAALDFALSATIFDGDDAALARTDVCQPAILTVTAAIWEVLRTTGRVEPAALRYVLGLSLGEYTAHYAAGTLAFEDAVRLVRRRGQYMQEASDATPSGMAAVMGVPLEGVEEACRNVRDAGGICVVANLNAPGQIVISGESAALARCTALLQEAGARRVVALNVAGAFHSPVMDPAAERLAADLEATEFRDPAVPVISNVTAAPVRTAAEARETLARQVVSPVLFERSLRLVLEGEAADLVEPGPGKTLSAFVRKIDRAHKVRSYDKADDIEPLDTEPLDTEPTA